jgi:hypothetical protein
MVYKRYSGKYATPGSNKLTMCLDEFVQCLSDANLLNEYFGNREAGPLFNVSMMTNKDETLNEKHLNMTFVEFLEALARVADKFDMVNMVDNFPEYKAKSPWGLDKKLESTLIQIV